MKRVDIYYDGQHYSIGGRDVEDVQHEISEGIASGAPYWLLVNSGEGRAREARLAISAATPIALVPSDD